MTINNLFGIGRKIIINIAGILLSITSTDVEVLRFLNPLYKLFLTSGDQFNTYQLGIFIRENQSDSTPEIDSHPKVVFFIDKITLNFTTGRLIFDLLNRTGELITSGENLALELEYCLRILFGYFVLQKGGLLIHGAGIARQNNGYIFLGPSGVGKSTVSRLSGNFILLNDDLTVILPDHDGTWKIFSTPFANPGQRIQIISVPLRGMYLLEQSDMVRLEKLFLGKAISEIIANIPVITGNFFLADQVISTCLKLLQKIPIFKLSFMKDPSFWDVILQ